MNKEENKIEGTLDQAGILTFSANRYAYFYLIASILCFCALLALAYATIFPGFQSLSGWWCLAPIAPIIAFLLLAWDTARHPYLLLDGEGIIQYPFSKKSIKTAWAHIQNFEIKNGNLELITTNPLADSSSDGIVKSIRLTPINKEQRDLLCKAVESQIIFSEE